MSWFLWNWGPRAKNWTFIKTLKILGLRVFWPPWLAPYPQITTSLGSSETSMAFAQMSIKLMNKGTHQRFDVVGMVMAQVLLKAAIKKWGREAVDSVGKEMKQLQWQNSFKPMQWKYLTANQQKKVLESHIFVEKK